MSKKFTKSCLIIIDVQHAFINNNTKSLPSRIVDVVKQEHFDLVIGTRYINSPNTACYKLGNWKDCMRESKDSELLPEIFDIVNGVFYKDTYSCYSDIMKRYLFDNQVDKVYFCGISTEACVLASILSAYDCVTDCYVIEDLCASTVSNELHNNAINVLKECITSERVIKSSDLKAHLAQSSNN